MLGLTQFRPLLLAVFMEHAAKNHANVAIASWTGSGFFRYPYAEASAERQRAEARGRRKDEPALSGKTFVMLALGRAVASGEDWARRTPPEGEPALWRRGAAAR